MQVPGSGLLVSTAYTAQSLPPGPTSPRPPTSPHTTRGLQPCAPPTPPLPTAHAMGFQPPKHPILPPLTVPSYTPKGITQADW